MVTEPVFMRAAGCSALSLLTFAGCWSRPAPPEAVWALDTDAAVEGAGAQGAPVKAAMDSDPFDCRAITPWLSEELATAGWRDAPPDLWDETVAGDALRMVRFDSNPQVTELAKSLTERELIMADAVSSVEDWRTAWFVSGKARCEVIRVTWKPGRWGEGEAEAQIWWSLPVECHGPILDVEPEMLRTYTETAWDGFKTASRLSTLCVRGGGHPISALGTWWYTSSGGIASDIVDAQTGIPFRSRNWDHSAPL